MSAAVEAAVHINALAVYIKAYSDVTLPPDWDTRDMPRFKAPGRKFLRRSMEKIRRSIRKSLGRNGRDARDSLADVGRRTSNGSAPSDKAPSLQQDEQSVRNNTCAFNVKYLGCIEVYESRGMNVCEEALKVLRQNRRKPVKAVLYVSGDGLRVVDSESNRGLLVDQTIEKVSFCAPDRNNDKGFAYICRDGTSRRWMCHGFSAIKETGERLSHAVGCAFAVCLEKKQARESTDASDAVKTAASPAGASSVNGAFQRSSVGSFRQATLAERKLDPQSVIVVDDDEKDRRSPAPSVDMSSARERPAARTDLFNRYNSLRMPAPQQQNFKRNYSLRADLQATGAPRLSSPQHNQSFPSTSAATAPMPALQPSAPTSAQSTLSKQQLIDMILMNTLDETSSESAKSYAPSGAQVNWGAISPVATSTPKRQPNANPTPLWDQSFVEEEEEDHVAEEAQTVNSVSPSRLPQSTTNDSFFGELDRQKQEEEKGQVEESPFKRATTSRAPPTPSQQSDDGQHSTTSSTQRSRADEWLHSTLRASLRRTPPQIQSPTQSQPPSNLALPEQPVSPPHTPFTPPEVPPRRDLPNSFSTDFQPQQQQQTVNQQHTPRQQWTQFSPEKQQPPNTNVFQPAPDPFEMKWRAFSLEQDNPFKNESTPVNM